MHCYSFVILDRRIPIARLVAEDHESGAPPSGEMVEMVSSDIVPYYCSVLFELKVRLFARRVGKAQSLLRLSGYHD